MEAVIPASDWKASASDNTSIGGIFTGPNMARADVDQAMRQMRADLVNEGAEIVGAPRLNTSLSAAYGAKQTGELLLKAGTQVFADTVSIATNRTSVIGEGAQATVVSFQPGATKAAIKYDGVSSLFQFRVGGLGFNGGADTSTKTAIEINDGRTFEVYDIGISEGAWLGSGSIGIHTKGRDSGHIRDLNLACARPFVASNNPDFPSIDADGFVFERWNVYTTLTTGKVMEFEDGFNFSNTVFRDLFLQKGKYAIYWNDTTSTVGSYGVVFDNFRDEQSDDATGYSIYLASSAQALQTVAFRNSYFTSGRNNIYLRNAKAVTGENCVFAGTGTLIDMTFVTGSSLFLKNSFQAGGGTMALTNARCVRRYDVAGVSAHEEWVYEPARPFSANVQDYTNLVALVELGEKVWKIRDTLPVNGGVSTTVLTPMLMAGLRSSAYVELRTNAGGGTAGYGLFMVRPDGTIDTVQRNGNVNQGGGANTCRIAVSSGRLTLIGDTLGTAINYTLILRGDY